MSEIILIRASNNFFVIMDSLADSRSESEGEAQDTKYSMVGVFAGIFVVICLLVYQHKKLKNVLKGRGFVVLVEKKHRSRTRKFLGTTQILPEDAAIRKLQVFYLEDATSSDRSLIEASYRNMITAGKDIRLYGPGKRVIVPEGGVKSASSDKQIDDDEMEGRMEMNQPQSMVSPGKKQFGEGEPNQVIYVGPSDSQPMSYSNENQPRKDPVAAARDNDI